MSPMTHAPLLVCATPSTHDEPQVVLADGSYETDAERVFWRTSPSAEVLRIPLQAPVSVRALRHIPQQRRPSDGEQRLLAALEPHRVERPEPPAVRRGELTEALCAGSPASAERAFRLIWERDGLQRAHDELAHHLRQAGADWASSRTGVLDERTASTTARTLLERLLSLPRTATRGRVLLAVPEGDRHVLALASLRHLLEDAGHSTVVLDDLPVDELAALSREPGTAAVAVSAHLPLPPVAARRLFGTLRDACPHMLLVGGGPGMPRTPKGADVVTDDAQQLVQAIAARGAVLTDREREVLLAVAEGLTNVEVAEALGVSPATVKTHLEHVFTKTGTEHRAAAVARAMRQGWIS